MTEQPGNLLRWLALALFGLALAAAGWRTPIPPPAVLSPSLAAPLAGDDLPAAARASPERPSPTRLANGRTAIAWLENGEAESAGIRLAIRDATGWRDMGRIASRESTAAAAFLHAQRLGRPLLWAEGGWLHLWYEAHPLGSASGAMLMHSVSTDGGRQWTKARRLDSTPFGGLGPRLGETLRPLADGGLLLPLAQAGGDGPWLRLSVTGQLVGRLPDLPALAAEPPR
ncbi:MAG: exo-alpha-sialidase [Azonexus sp.]